MTKEELLYELSMKVTQGELTREEVMAQLGLTGMSEVPAMAPVPPASADDLRHLSATKMLYFFGAAVAITGISFFIAQIWDDLGSLGRISVTLGLGLLLTTLGTMLLVRKQGDYIGPIFVVLGGFLIPGGSVVTLAELGNHSAPEWPLAITFGIITCFYLLLTVTYRHVWFTFFTIANSTAFIYLLTDALTRGAFYRHETLYAYLTMAVGISYLLLARTFAGGWNDRLVSALYLFGSIAFYAAAFSRVFDSGLWQLLFFALVLGGLFVSTAVKSRNLLVVSSLALVAHITYITNEYFAHSLGWPISLIILGFVFIGLGYLSVNLNKKYIQS